MGTLLRYSHINRTYVCLLHVTESYITNTRARSVL